MASTANLSFNVAMPAIGIQTPVLGKNFVIWEARVKAYLAAMNAISAIEQDVPLGSMTAKQLQADNIAKG
ncbi:hypothetical protein V1527DRAFT_454911, partial [Lipomyces starkeyi]